MSRCVRLCREQREQTPARPIRADLGRLLRADEGRKSKQDKEQASSATPCSVTSARSAGSYGGQGVLKWGQNRRGDITSAVVIPESLLPQENNKGHTRYRSGFRGKREICQPPGTVPLPVNPASSSGEIRIHMEQGARDNDYIQDENADRLKEALKGLEHCGVRCYSLEKSG